MSQSGLSLFANNKVFTLGGWLSFNCNHLHLTSRETLLYHLVLQLVTNVIASLV